MSCLATIEAICPGLDVQALPHAQALEIAKAIDELQLRQARGEEMPAGSDLMTGPACFVERVLQDEETGEFVINAPFHIDWQAFWSAHRLAVIMAPVGHGKTAQLLTRVIWEIGKNPQLRVGIICLNDAQAKTRLAWIKDQIRKNERIREVFPDLAIDPREKDNEHEFTVYREARAKEPTIQAFSVGSASITGSRLDLIVLDDVLDMETTRTEEQLKKTVTWFDSKVYGRLPRHGRGRIWVIGTPWDRSDLLHVLQGRSTYAFSKYSAVVNAKAPQSEWVTLWASVYTPAVAREDYESMHPSEFARTLLCEIVDEATRRFKEEWIDRSLQLGRAMTLLASAPRAHHLGPYLPCFTGVDLGVGQDEDHDLTAIVTIALDDRNRRRLVDIEAGRWTSPEILQRIQAAHWRYRSIVGVESNAAQEYMTQFTANLGIPVVSHYTGSNKLAPDVGIEHIAVEMRAGLWVFPSNAAGEADEEEVKALLEDMRHFRPKRHVGDRLLALWIARNLLREHSTPNRDHLDTQAR